MLVENYNLTALVGLRPGREFLASYPLLQELLHSFVSIGPCGPRRGGFSRLVAMVSGTFHRTAVPAIVTLNRASEVAFNVNPF